MHFQYLLTSGSVAVSGVLFAIEIRLRLRRDILELLLYIRRYFFGITTYADTAFDSAAGGRPKDRREQRKGNA
jgi:hypothetical protein